MPRRFTLLEAESLLPEIEQWMREAVALKKQYEAADSALDTIAQRVMMRGGMVVDRTAVLENRAARDRSGERLKAAVEAIQEQGCVIKDLDMGLVDFPTLFRGEEVYLCWKLGETGIKFWHGVNEGFGGRKTIDREFLDNHSGGLSN